MSNVTRKIYPSLDFDLGFEIDQLRETVREFSDHEIAPRAEAIDREDKFPRDLWPQMGAIGLHGITVDEDYGGTQMGYLAHVVAMEEVSRGSASVGLSYGAHSNLCINQIARNGNEERDQDVDNQRHRGRCFGRLREDRSRRGFSRYHRVSGRKRYGWFCRGPETRQAGHAGLAHLRIGFYRLRSSGRERVR